MCEKFKHRICVDRTGVAPRPSKQRCMRLQHSCYVFVQVRYGTPKEQDICIGTLIRPHKEATVWPLWWVFTNMFKNDVTFIASRHQVPCITIRHITHSLKGLCVTHRYHWLITTIPDSSLRSAYHASNVCLQLSHISSFRVDWFVWSITFRTPPLACCWSQRGHDTAPSGTHLPSRSLFWDITSLYLVANVIKIPIVFFNVCRYERNMAKKRGVTYRSIPLFSTYRANMSKSGRYTVSYSPKALLNIRPPPTHSMAYPSSPISSLHSHIARTVSPYS